MIEVRIPQAERVHLMANGLYYSYHEEKGIDLKRCTRIQCKKTGDLILTCPKATGILFRKFNKEK